MPDIRVLEDRTVKALAAREAKYATEVTRRWKTALDEMRVSMSKIYEKYAVDGVLTRADMTRYNRYVAMEKQMVQIAREAAADTKRVLDRLRPDMYNESFFRYAWTIDNSEAIRVSWGLLNKDAVLENLNNEFYRIAKDRYSKDVIFRTRTALNQGLISGKGYPAMVKDLKNAINSTNYEALRILRTEGQDAVNAGQDNCYSRAEEEGVEGVQIWDSTLDGETREDHQAMDGQSRQPDGLYDGPGGERAPYPVWSGLPAKQRIHCRCHQRFQVKDFPPLLRRSRDGGVIPYQNYDEWKKGQKT